MILPIATINYNGSRDTIALIDSLVKSGEEFDLIVVDNKSPQDGELERIAEAVKSSFKASEESSSYCESRIESIRVLRLGPTMIVTLIQACDNYGFSAGTNIGLRYGLEEYPESPYLTILNNDTEVTSGFLSRVIRAMGEHSLAAAMGTILYYGYERPYIWSIGGPIRFRTAQGIHIDKDREFIPENYPTDYVLREFISGCFTVFEKKALLEIGLLDEDYFFAGEEYQYSLDLNRKYRIGWVPESIIYHKSQMGIGNGSSHRISDLKWQYNAYMVKVVFTNKNQTLLGRLGWHLLFRVYVLVRLRKKYLQVPEYGEKGYRLMKRELFRHIGSTCFVKRDFEEFAELTKAL